MDSKSKFDILASLCSERKSTNCDAMYHICHGEHTCNIQSIVREHNKTEVYSETNMSTTQLTEVIDLNNDTGNTSHVHPKNLNVKPPLNENSNRNTQSAMQKFNFQRRGLHLSTINICHLKPKLDEIKLLLSSANNVDVLGICENFLNKNVDDKTINIDNYIYDRKKPKEAGL